MIIFLDIDDTINDFTAQMNAIEPFWFLSSTCTRTLFFCYNDRSVQKLPFEKH
ncbi:hypothetical protein JT086_01650 [Helicobacter pylori]|nr:hypothetical protein [Helicobacter pylori]